MPRLSIPAPLAIVFRRPMFLLLVVVPVLVTAVYVGLVEADTYVSTSEFIVRSPNEQSSDGLLGMFMQNTGLTRSQDDAYALQNFILSRDAIAGLQKNLDLRKIWGAPNGDALSRFPGPINDRSDEALFDYYGHRVTVDMDSVSSITTLQVAAFTPQDAQNINRELLSLGESLINVLNERANRNAVGDAQAAVDLAQVAVTKANDALRDFRTQQKVLDPQAQSEIQIEQIGNLRASLIETRAQLEQLKTAAPHSPQIAGLQSRIAALEQQVSDETLATTNKNGSLVTIAGDYQRFLLDQELAARRLASAMETLETAKEEARKQSLYVDHIVQPSLSDRPEFPQPFRAVLIAFVTGLLAYGVLNLVIAGVREHQQ